MNKVFLILISVLIIPIGVLIGKELIQTEKNNYQNKFLPGKYVRVKLNFFDKSVLYLKGVRHLRLTDTLYVNKDSTYKQKFCNDINFGTWYYNKDTLYTTPFSSKFKGKKYYFKNNTLTVIYTDKSWYDKYKFEEDIEP